MRRAMRAQRRTVHVVYLRWWPQSALPPQVSLPAGRSEAVRPCAVCMVVLVRPEPLEPGFFPLYARFDRTADVGRCSSLE